ncbi:MAG: tRNA (adenosine(37)-N6)-threonylcarbamoyltransferase complex dimerization subunit type 1 TsaB [Bacteroidia bacterium]
MPLILNIETATDVCSVALAKNGTLLSLAESKESRTHARVITLLIQQVMNDTKHKFSDLDAIAVSKGPGSYTGLRIGVATAKGLCYALQKPLIAINTLKIMAANFIRNSIPSTRDEIRNSNLVPLIDARRMEVYTAVFDEGLNTLMETKAEIINENSFAAFLNNHKTYFFGDGVPKCKTVLHNNKNAVFIDEFTTSASGMIQFSKTEFANNKFEDIAYFEPFYLKEFVKGATA